MGRLWMIALQLVMVWCMGFAALPRPCMGDAEGQACTATTCTCVAACTCHQAHERAERLAKAIGPLPGCCKTKAGQLAASEALLAACHGPEAPPNFAPPRSPGDAALAQANFVLRLAATRPRPAPAPADPATRPIPPPVPPPWRT